MFGLFKNKETKQVDKQKQLEQELEEFDNKYRQYFNSYAFNGEDIIIYKKPYIREGEVVMGVITSDTPEGLQMVSPLWLMKLKYGEEFLRTHRFHYLKIKDQLEKLGLTVEKRNNE